MSATRSLRSNRRSFDRSNREVSTPRPTGRRAMPSYPDRVTDINPSFVRFGVTPPAADRDVVYGGTGTSVPLRTIRQRRGRTAPAGDRHCQADKSAAEPIPAVKPAWLSRPGEERGATWVTSVRTDTSPAERWSCPRALSRRPNETSWSCWNGSRSRQVRDKNDRRRIRRTRDRYRACRALFGEHAHKIARGAADRRKIQYPAAFETVPRNAETFLRNSVKANIRSPF